ncbi:RDD family protein [Chitinophaga sp. MM2321]|uniref:RDD family protein n=1 Tax=Chitinophaga sp. MM2321 TaxID=3137178 RepID=UPI0032D56EB7
MEQVNETNSHDLLSDLKEAHTFEPATRWHRFANFVIDYIVVLGILLVLIVAFYTLSDATEELGTLELQILFAVLFVVYYGLMEGYVNGRTVGKMITKTRVVRHDEQPMSVSKALLRGVTRLVPFEPLTGFGSAPLHDKWTDTYVIKDN